MQDSNIFIDDRYNYKVMEITKEINEKLEKPKSVIQIGNITVYCTKKFNWFNKLMMKLIFGWEVKNCGSNDLHV